MGYATPVVSVGTNSGSVAASSTLTVTVGGSGIPAGSLIIVTTVSGGSANGTHTYTGSELSDTLNSYQVAEHGLANGSSANGQAVIFYNWSCLAVPNGTNISLTNQDGSNARTLDMSVVYVQSSPTVTTDPLDAAASTSNGVTGTGSAPSGQMRAVPAVGSSLAIGLTYQASASVITWTQDSGNGWANPPNAVDKIESGWKTTSTQDTYAPGTNRSAAWVVLIAVFKPGANWQDGFEQWLRPPPKRVPWRARPEAYRQGDIEGLPFTAVKTNSATQHWDEERHFLKTTPAWRARPQAFFDEFLLNPPTVTVEPWGFDEEQHEPVKRAPRIWRAPRGPLWDDFFKPQTPTDPIIDGTASGHASSSPVTITLTTTIPNDLICVAGEINTSVSGPWLGVSSANTTGWSRRSSVASFDNANHGTELWYGTVSGGGTLTNEVITVTGTGTVSFLAVVGFGISNLNVSAPFDPSSLPVTTTGSPQIHLSIPTAANYRDVLIAAYRINTSVPSAGSGWTEVVPAFGNFFLVEYQTVPVGGASYSATIGTGDGTQFEGIGDALGKAGSQQYWVDEYHQIPRRLPRLSRSPDEFLQVAAPATAAWGFDEEQQQLPIRHAWRVNPEPLRNGDIEGFPFTAVVTPTSYYDEENHRLQRRREWRAGGEIFRQGDIEGLPFTAAAPTAYYDEENHRLIFRVLWRARPEAYRQGDVDGLPFTAVKTGTAYYDEENHRLKLRVSWRAGSEAFRQGDVEGLLFTAATPTAYYDEENHRLKLRREWRAAAEVFRQGDIEGLPFTAVVTNSATQFWEEENHRLQRRQVWRAFSEALRDEFLAQQPVEAWAFDEEQHFEPKRRPWRAIARQENIDDIGNVQLVGVSWAFDEPAFQRVPRRRAWRALASPANADDFGAVQLVGTAWGFDEPPFIKVPRRREWRATPSPPNADDFGGVQLVGVPWAFDEPSFRQIMRRAWRAIARQENIDDIGSIQLVGVPWAFEEEQHRQQRRRDWRASAAPTSEDGYPFTAVVTPSFYYDEENHRLILRVVWRARPEIYRQGDIEGYPFTTAPVTTSYYEEEQHRQQRRREWRAIVELFRQGDIEGLPFTAVVTPSSLYDDQPPRSQRSRVFVRQANADELITPATQIVVDDPAQSVQRRRRVSRLLQTPNADDFGAVQLVGISWSFDEPPFQPVPRRRSWRAAASPPNADDFGSVQLVGVSWGFDEPAFRQLIRRPWRAIARQETIDDIGPVQLVGIPWGFDEPPFRQLVRRPWRASAKQETIDDIGSIQLVGVPWAFDEPTVKAITRRAWRAAARQEVDGDFSIVQPVQQFVPWAFEEEQHQLERRSRWRAASQPTSDDGYPFTAIKTPSLYYDEENHRLILRAPWRARPEIYRQGDIEGYPFTVIVATSSGVTTRFIANVGTLMGRR